jgi:outer membrane protein OmpA-like peptidoglycan-associated protein/tetratricopeptide (TPR) repeat protein
VIDIKYGALLFFLWQFAGLASGQSADLAGMSAARLKKSSINAERYGDYYTALSYYQAYAMKKENSADVQYKLALLQEKNRDYKEAAAAYMEAYLLDDTNPQALFDHIRMVKMTGEIALAKTKYEDFEGMLREKGYDNSWKRILRTEINSCDTALTLMTDSLPVKITNLGNRINGPHQDFAPIPLNDSTLVFGSLRENRLNYYSVDSTSTRRQLYVSSLVEGEWTESEIWQAPFNTPDYHVVNGSFNKARDIFICTRCQENWKKEMNCKLWMSKLKGGAWQAPSLLPEDINEMGTIVTQPAFAFDQRKNRDVLYFVSNAPDGQGGMDIYYTYFDERKKTWKSPRNLGRRVNGSGDEITPYFQQKEQKLYFSSNSRTGMGGLDIYASRGELSKFASPENVGYPINSSVDDFYFVLNDDRESGFFVSNRAGGYQMINETCCDDIYSFGIDDVIHIEMEGFVMRVDGDKYLKGEGDLLSSASFNTDFLEAVDVDLYLIEKDGEVLMQRLATSGDGIFKMEFEADKEYRIVLSKPGFFTNHIDVDTRGITQNKLIRQNIGLSEFTENTVLVQNINYDFDSAELSPGAQDEITKGVLNMMLENPGLVIEIGSHTDNRGDEEYNLNLSQQRAESVVRFLSARGISSERLKAKGYGETLPIAGNTNADGSDNPEGRAENRRTEFKILDVKEVPSELPDEDEE